MLIIFLSCRYSEKSKTKCIGITIETRPDYCLKRHISCMLQYGCTRLEIGVQSVYEDVARDTNRCVLSHLFGYNTQSKCEYNAQAKCVVQDSKSKNYFLPSYQFFIILFGRRSRKYNSMKSSYFGARISNGVVPSIGGWIVWPPVIQH